MNDSIRIDERYVYRRKIIPTIPSAYYARDAAQDSSEALLYPVCSDLFYLEGLFEQNEHEAGITALQRCELACC